MKFGTYTKFRVLITNIIITFPQSKKFRLKIVFTDMAIHYAIAYNITIQYVTERYNKNENENENSRRFQNRIF